MIKSSRLIAFDVIHKIFNDSSYSNLTLDNALKSVKEDKAFISALVYGVVERKLTLDFYINKFLTSKPKPKILTILRMGAYQLLFMDKVPVSAAINESVKLTKDINQDYYSKLVNAVLHKIDDNREMPDDLSIKYSIPEHLLNMWIKQYGRDVVEKFLPATLEKPPIFAVPNSLLCDQNDLIYELLEDNVECEGYNEVVKINSTIDLKSLKAFKNGLLHIQDYSSFLCSRALDVKENDVVLDMCAAPGGKSFTIAQSLKNTGKVYSFDLYENRVNLITQGANRLAINNIKAYVNDATIYNSNIPKADKILCDVVCSGFGIIRRKPEIKYKELDSVKELPEIQYSILDTSSKYLKNGGRIIYSTCTLNKKENQSVVKRFLENNNEFELKYDKTIFPSFEGGDGFYYAVMEKNEN